jgi:predicted helicase
MQLESTDPLPTSIPSQISGVSAVIESLRVTATSERDKGDRFERLMQTAFRLDRTYRERFSDVWLWMDWPERGNEPDIGIDLVAKNSSGGYTAIQCKCYAQDTTLTKEDIDSFFTASGRKPFTERIIVATTDRWSVNAEKSMSGQHIPVVRIGIDDLDAMTIDWSSFDAHNLTGLVAAERKKLRAHQAIAVDKVRAGFGESDRGKLIMACGTGKTFTGLRIAEEHAGAGKAVLFLAPSIALVAQSLKEWTAECDVPIRPFAVCSDATAGKPIEGENATAYDLPIAPTTNVEALIAAGVDALPASAMTVVFCTYQSIQVVADVQTATGLTFDLVVCDEAHRTSGVSKKDEESSAFLKVHDDLVVPAHKRLYMTATPKIYKAAAKLDAAERDIVAASMDDPEIFGPEFHRLGFGEAIELGLLADYKVLILTVEEKAISKSFQTLLSSNGELNLPDVAKFVGCLSGLAKQPGKSGSSGFTDDELPMQRAVAFWSSIEESERFAAQFELVADHYNRERAADTPDDQPAPRSLAVPTRHVDGTDSIRSRRTDIRWLKETPPEDECRVLTNAKCLTEGVDVPALDAVMFLKPRRSKIDIVQAVGRVMRKPAGKQIGYIILPVAIPAGVDPANALDSNKDYDIVWEVIQALRAHDERFNAYINRLALRTEKTKPEPGDPIEIVNVDVPTPDTNPEPEPGTSEPEPEPDPPVKGIQGQLFTFEDWTGAIYTKIVAKVGARRYWEDWANDVAAIANRHEIRITAILHNQPEVAAEFDRFLEGLHDILNDSISSDDAISMLSQHLITRPIFEAIFGTDSFTANNPVSQVMQKMVDVLDQHNLDTETASLDGFYESVRRRVEGEQDAGARQRIIKDLYGQFFKTAFPKIAEKLGIVYTPIEVVDFIIRATQAALDGHFNGASISDQGVHVLDPFTGTGTFITRLLQSGLIQPADLQRKFSTELHANEVLLLAYYIAAINIETTYQQLTPDWAPYEPFPGIVLTDTFQAGEAAGTGAFDVFPVNNARATRQQGLDIRVILGNPPYSVGQESANDNNANHSYPKLDASIASTYAAKSTATLKNSLYDSYIRAIRWASDRIIKAYEGGIIAFVTNGGYIDSNTADGIRLTLAAEFDHIYIYNLRGNQRTSGDLSRKEGGKIFGAGSRTTTAIMLLVRTPGPVDASGAKLLYKDIGDNLSRDEKLAILDKGLRPSDIEATTSLGSVGWTTLQSNVHGDWINHRSDAFGMLTAAHATKGLSIFTLRTNGLKSNRDAWNYNASLSKLEANVERMIAYYNSEVDRFAVSHPLVGQTPVEERTALAKSVVGKDAAQFSWDRADYDRVAKGQRYTSSDARYMVATYRPFQRRYVNAGTRLNNCTYRLPSVYPHARAENLSICVSTVGARNPFSVYMTKDLPDIHLWVDDTPCFPRHTYKQSKSLSREKSPNLFGSSESSAADLTQIDNITDDALHLYNVLDASITKDDVFFYVYGILHSPDYRARFAADLKRSLPRIPSVDNGADFWSFSNAGRELGRLHTEYETVDPWPQLRISYTPGFSPDSDDVYLVDKMRYPKTKGSKDDDRSSIVYNSAITIDGIPLRAHGYLLGSRSAIDWLIESYRVKRDKASGIENDPNDWARDRGEPTYILDLIGRVVTVSMRTLDLVDGLPALKL